MKQTRLMAIAVACATIATAAVVTTHIVHGQSSPPIYNPYPTGILPPDIASEETRVQTEIAGIEKSYFTQWQAMTPPVVAGNPPILMNTGCSKGNHSFGESYDPQPFHIDEGAGENSFFSGLCASGWLTAAIVMRLRVESIKVKGGMIGAGVDEMRWTHPVRPDDKLRTESEVLEVRRSVNRPGFGIVRSRTTVFNQHNVTVMKSIVNWLAPLRNA
jgi:acyl dehydratase